MAVFNRKEFNKLSAIHDTKCVSIYVPTHIKNDEGDGYIKDQIRLKNQLDEVKKQMLTMEMKESEISSYLEPVRKLLDDTEFWMHQSRTLVIFYHGGELMTYSVTEPFREFAYVNDHFYLKPLTTLLHGSERHYILALSLGKVKMYEGSKTDIREVELPGEVPGSLEDAVGKDYEPKTLQQRTQQGETGDANGMFHGQGSGSESEKKKEALRYLRGVNDALEDFLKGEDTPLIVACVDYLFPMYQEVNTYDYLMDDFIAGNYEHEPLKSLHEKAWSIVEPRMQEEMKESMERFSGLVNEGKSSADEKTAIPASIGGRTETLFLKENETMWGTYREDTHSINVHEVRKVGDADLLNLAAVETINHGGKVYILPKEHMPVSTSEVNAIFRYDRGGN